MYLDRILCWDVIEWFWFAGRMEHLYVYIHVPVA